MKKKIVFLSIIFVLIISVVLLHLESTPTKKVYIDNNIEEINKNGVAVYIEEDNGNYSKTTSFPNKESGYVLNTSKSVCDGSTRISWDNDKWGLELSNIDRENMKCYLYFRKKQASDTVLAGIEVKESPDGFTGPATTDEGIFRAKDDDGETYYYRGAVDNNWVKFANMYWRIIRFNGDGTIRLIYTGDASLTNVTVDANGITATGEGTQIGTSVYNSYDNDNAYVGYMYGSTGQSGDNAYANTHKNTNNSVIKEVLDSWYKTNIVDKGYDGEVDKNSGFCNDRQVDNNADTRFHDDGYGVASTVYSPWGRLWFYNGSGGWKATQTLTFKCSQSNDLFTTTSATKGNKSLIYPVGLITSDEVIYAGSFGGVGNSNYYLYTNQQYRTMSPAYYNGSNAGVFEVYYDGRENGSSVDIPYGVRPVINIRADIQFQDGGDGTFNSPFVVS